jgi:hypothetical protein
MAKLYPNVIRFGIHRVFLWRWMHSLSSYEEKLNDYNFGTLLRTDAKGDYTEHNTIFGVLLTIVLQPKGFHRVLSYDSSISCSHEGSGENTLFRAKKALISHSCDIVPRIWSSSFQWLVEEWAHNHIPSHFRSLETAWDSMTKSTQKPSQTQFWPAPQISHLIVGDGVTYYCTRLNTHLLYILTSLLAIRAPYK